ncbi:MAG: hypothetical protein IJ622_06320 [Bacteroidales bacterium]|nr:hypothetical protein [Bacteroidales bacterium]
MENDTKGTIKVRQVIGEDAIEMTVQVTQEELDKMEQIRRFCPEDWEGKELELLQEARKLLRETSVESITTKKEEQKEQNVQPKEVEKESAKSSNGMWWTLGVLGVLLIGYLIVNSIIQQKAKEATEFIVRSSMNRTAKTLNYEGLTLEYPGNWAFSQNKISEEMYMVGGQDEKDSEFGIIWTTNTDASVSGFIDDIITGYVTSNRFTNVEYSAIYETHFNGMSALAADYSYSSKGEQYHAKVLGFVANGNTVIVNPIAHTKEALAGEDFKMMENTMRFTNTH